MSYAEAAHHAPTTSDPTPDPSLLISPDETTPNPDAKHVHVAPPTQPQPEQASELKPVVPQKRENENGEATPSSSTTTTGGSPSSTTGGKKSGKKGKKGKKNVAVTLVHESQQGGEKKSEEKEDSTKSGQPEAKKQKSTESEEKRDEKEKETKATTEKKEGDKVGEKEEDSQKIEQESKPSQDGQNDESEQEKDEPAGKRFDTELEALSSTQKNPTVSKDLDEKLADPYVPRANIAATVEHPQGTTENDYAETHKHESVLQQHVSFFDRDGDGIIWPLDTFVGFHNLGYSLIWCILAVFLIHPTFSWFTLSSWIPDPFLRIKVKSIHRARHGSDTGVYDSQGRFVSAKFEEIFEKFDKDKKGGLTFIEGLKMIRENRNVLDPIGWIGAFFEWFASYLLIWPKDGIVTKEDLRTIYDGSLFYAVAEKESTVRARQHRFYSGLFKENRSGDINKFHKKIQ
ncbi:uncharacterized protein JCM6883_000735 [Sporobolomyces salmoneus]|uniref:uncharacterized protein n=1 Tax=Sporobolomyces salmoneus TaxID=183962 RepID=UPI00316C54A8